MSPQRRAYMTQVLCRHLGIERKINWHSVAAGCINQAAFAQVGDKLCFVKWNEQDLAGQFAVEAAGLLALRESNSGLVVPRPIVADDSGADRAFLAMEYLEAGHRIADFDEKLGRGLARLHANTGAQGFGFSSDGFCGATPQPNDWMTSWPDFYRERRLLHQLRLARDRGLPPQATKLGEQIAARLDELLGAPEAPALIHGDLWSGNLHVSSDGFPALIDPAAYYGHREAELGMMVLFGGFSPRVFSAYQEIRPLQAGWEDRLPLYSLYHVLNHFVLFGGSYADQAIRIMRRYS